MHNFNSRLLLLAGSLAALISLGHAQVLTVDTINNATFNASNAINARGQIYANEAYTQTFSGITSIDTLTFRFVTYVAGGAPTSLNVYFSTWSGNAAVTELGAGTINIPAVIPSWTDAGGGFYTYDASIDLTQVATALDSSTTYALSIVGNSTTGSNVDVVANANGTYAGGSAFDTTGVSSFSDLSSGGTTLVNGIAFLADSSIASNVLSPVPETNTAAVWLAALFVGGLVIVRIRQRRRRLQAVPISE